MMVIIFPSMAGVPNLIELCVTNWAWQPHCTDMATRIVGREGRLIYKLGGLLEDRATNEREWRKAHGE